MAWRWRLLRCGSGFGMDEMRREGRREWRGSGMAKAKAKGGRFRCHQPFRVRVLPISPFCHHTNLRPVVTRNFFRRSSNFCSNFYGSIAAFVKNSYRTDLAGIGGFNLHVPCRRIQRFHFSPFAVLSSCGERDLVFVVCVCLVLNSLGLLSLGFLCSIRFESN